MIYFRFSKGTKDRSTCSEYDNNSLNSIVRHRPLPAALCEWGEDGHLVMVRVTKRLPIINVDQFSMRFGE